MSTKSQEAVKRAERKVAEDEMDARYGIEGLLEAIIVMADEIAELRILIRQLQGLE